MMPGLKPGLVPSRPQYVIVNVKTEKKTKLYLENISTAPIAVLILDKKRLLYYKDDALWMVNRDGSNNEKLVHVGKLLELLVLNTPSRFCTMNVFALLLLKRKLMAMFIGFTNMT